VQKQKKVRKYLNIAVLQATSLALIFLRRIHEYFQDRHLRLEYVNCTFPSFTQHSP